MEGWTWMERSRRGDGEEERKKESQFREKKKNDAGWTKQENTA